MKKLITIVEFWIGVNIIGLPLIHTHQLYNDKKELSIPKSKFHK